MPSATLTETKTRPPSAAVIQAWAEYDRTTRDCHPIQYDEVEEHAWTLLQDKLEAANAKAF